MHPSDVTAGVRTVAQMAEYFEELKGTALTLSQRITAQQRGYFTPDEEDELLGVLVSYWHTRSALFDLISSMRTAAEVRTEAYPVYFLVAFAAATILVDAARFLRELVAQRPLLRDKLNEPAAQFGIPEGTYDAIQQSLLSARNGWHLYHAMNYYQVNAGQLREIAISLEALPLIQVIERLLARLDISVAQFTRAKLRTRGSTLARQTAWTTVGRAMYGMQKLAGILLSNKYVRPGHTPQLPSDISRELLQVLMPGDVLVVRKEYALTNYFLPGYWPHAALYLGNRAQINALGIQDHENLRQRWGRLTQMADAEPGIVLESMKDGVHLRSLASPLGSDSIVILRPRMTAAEIAKGLARGLAHESKPYDFGFDFRRSDRLVCTEVVYRAFDGIGSMRFPLVRRAGRPTLSGGDLLEQTLAGEHLVPVAVFAPGITSGIYYGEAAVPVIIAATRNELR